jgi:hypothetical protein
MIIRVMSRVMSIGRPFQQFQGDEARQGILDLAPLQSNVRQFHSDQTRCLDGLPHDTTPEEWTTAVRRGVCCAGSSRDTSSSYQIITRLTHVHNTAVCHTVGKWF